MKNNKETFAQAVERIATRLENQCDSLDLARQLRVAADVMGQRQMSHLTGTITTLTANALAKRSKIPEQAFVMETVKELLFEAALASNSKEAMDRALGAKPQTFEFQT